MSVDFVLIEIINVLSLYVTQWLKTRRFLDIELETQIEESGFRVCNSSIQLVSLNLPL